MNKRSLEIQLGRKLPPKPVPRPGILIQEGKGTILYWIFKLFGWVDTRE